MTSVYIIRAGDTNNYKIGISDNPQNRLESLQTAHYRKLSILHQRAFDSRHMALITEEELHTQYQEFNTLGEWFYFDNNQVQAIIEYLSQDVTEVLLLKARIKELEKVVKQNPQPQQHQEPKEKKSKASKEDLTKAILESVGVDGKVISKSKLINVKDRRECNLYRDVVSELQQRDVLEYRNGYGYFLKEVK